MLLPGDSGMGSDKGVHNTLRLIFGLGVMLLGLLLTLDNFGLLRVRLILVWPVLLIGLGLAKLFYARRPAARPVAFFFIFLGVGLLLHNSGLLPFRQLIALSLVALGATIVWRTARRPACAAAPTPDTGRHLDVVALLGGIQRTLSAQDFQGGNASAVLGGCEIDLTRASIANGEATLNTFAFWGGIDIKVPVDWSVEMQGTALLGGFSDSSRPPDDDRKKLIVTGYVLMGGVEVHN